MAVVYQYIGNVSLKNETDYYEAPYITSFNDYGDEIIVESCTPIEGVKRGWVGDLYYQSMRAYEVCSGEEIPNKIMALCLKDVLLARFAASSDSGNPVVWRYTFLKY